MDLQKAYLKKDALINQGLSIEKETIHNFANLKILKEESND
jgi:hypothetical protein